MIMLTSITPEYASEDGGYLIQLLGDFSEHLGELFSVHIGPTESDNDEKCESGIPGQPQKVYPLNATEMRCFTPALDPGLYSVYVVGIDSPLVNDSLTAVIRFLPKGFETSVHDLRKIMPPGYYVGPRSIEREEPV